MAPSSSARRSTELGAAASEARGGDGVSVMPQGHPDDPLLYTIPDKLHVAYRSLPALAQVGIVLLSMWMSAVSTWKRVTFLHPLAILRGLRPAASPGEILAFTAKVRSCTKFQGSTSIATDRILLTLLLIQTLLFSLILQLSLQDICFPPSRISTDDLLRKFHLPSALSRYEKVSLLDESGTAKDIGVHYLKYRGKESSRAGLFGAVYVHHGFGASSLSWLPALPSLVDRLGARCGLGHDMVGFGFTDRQEELEWYTTDASARISQAVFTKEASRYGTPFQSVALLGHSLGAIGVLKMALKLPAGLSKVIILSSPALGLNGRFPQESINQVATGPLTSFKENMSAFFRRSLIFPVGGYVLRRIVG